MTESDLITFYPQFAGFTPAIVLSVYVRQANERFSPFRRRTRRKPGGCTRPTG
jgi:hypothetical protein